MERDIVIKFTIYNSPVCAIRRISLHPAPGISSNPRNRAKNHFLLVISRNGLKRSIGMGNTIVELFSVATSDRVARNLN